MSGQVDSFSCRSLSFSINGDPSVTSSDLFSMPSESLRNDSIRFSQAAHFEPAEVTETSFQKFMDVLRSLSQGIREFFASIVILFSSRAFDKAIKELDIPD